MGRVIAIDWGGKRTGLAWTDPLQIIATGIGSFPTPEVLAKLKSLVAENEVEEIVLGHPSRLNGEETHATGPVLAFKKKLGKHFPELSITSWDERMSSKRAMSAMVQGGVPKKKRRNKNLINEISAVLILQEYLESRV